MEVKLEAVACVDGNVGFVGSCCIGLLYSRRRLPYKARKVCVAACHTFGAAGNILPLHGGVLRLVCAVEAVPEQVFVFCR